MTPLEKLMTEADPDFHYEKGGDGDGYEAIKHEFDKDFVPEDIKNIMEDKIQINRKKGITPYMIEYDSKFEGKNYFEGFDSKEMMKEYLETNPLYEKEATKMPPKIGFTLFNKILDSVELRNQLQDLFTKFVSPKYESEILIPEDMKLTFERSGIDKESPAMYSMICWIVDANKFSGTLGMTFDEFISYADFFFT